MSGVKVRHLLVDRGFFSIAVMNFLSIWLPPCLGIVLSLRTSVHAEVGATEASGAGGKMLDTKPQIVLLTKAKAERVC